MHKKILVPTDGSEQAKRAGKYAISTANLLDEDLVVLYVIDTHYLDALPQQDLADQIRSELKAEGEKALESFKKDLEEFQCGGECKNINITTMIKEGKPADIILKTIDEEGISEVVMGKSGKHGLERFVMGSTADKVVRLAKASVNVIA